MQVRARTKGCVVRVARGTDAATVSARIERLGKGPLMGRSGCRRSAARPLLVPRGQGVGSTLIERGAIEVMSLELWMDSASTGLPMKEGGVGKNRLLPMRSLAPASR